MNVQWNPRDTGSGRDGLNGNGRVDDGRHDGNSLSWNRTDVNKALTAAFQKEGALGDRVGVFKLRVACSWDYPTHEKVICQGAAGAASVGGGGLPSSSGMEDSRIRLMRFWRA